MRIILKNTFSMCINMGFSDFDINFEKDSDNKDMSIIDDLKNDGLFNIKKR